MKKILALLLSAGMAFSFAGCGGSAPSSSTTPTDNSSSTPSSDTASVSSATDATVSDVESQVPAGGTIGICIYKFDDNFMTVYRNKLKEILEGKGYEVSIQDGNNDQAKQTEQINTFITQGVDALIINPVQTTAAASIIQLVKDANIPTVIINREPTGEDMALWDKVAYVGCDAAQSGTFQGELILETANKGDINGDGKISYIMIQGDPENIDAKLRTEYSVKALTDAGMQVEELDLQRGDWDQAKGQEICATDLSKFGDQVEVVFSNNDAMALGAIEAIKAANRVVGENIYIVGVDALADALAKVQSGDMTGTVLNDADSQAVKAVEVMEELLGGKSYTPEEQQIYVDYVKVTQANVADFM